MTSQSPRHVAVIDIGKTNAKVALIDMESLAEIAVRRLPNTVLRDGPYPHYDVEGFWDFILDTLGGLHGEHTVDAITVTTHGAACALLDAAGRLALLVLDYEHDGPDTLAADYDAIRPPFAETGSPRLPAGLNMGAQLYWQQRCFPDAFGNVAAIVMYPQYWSFRLTGVAANEVTSLGAHSDLWDPAKRDYSTLVDRSGWRRLFAPLRRSADCLGPVLPEIAARTGLRADTEVYCGIHDSNASLLPHLIGRAPPFSVVSTGTWVIAMSVGGQVDRLDPERDTLINVNAFGDPVHSARFMGGRERAILTEGLDDECAAEDVATVLAKRILLLPSVQAGHGPYARRKAEWISDQPIQPGERQAAIAFYLAMMTATSLELIGADGPVIADGPFARNDLYLRMLAAATGRDVIANTDAAVGTRAGAALLTSPGASPPRCSDVVVDTRGALWTDYAKAWHAALRGSAG
jgi:sugar (pentulose or hexulose) kinase